MYVYLIMLGLTVVLAICWNAADKRLLSQPYGTSFGQKSFSFAAMMAAALPMYCFSAFMYYVGNDYWNYKTYFYRIMQNQPQEVDWAYKMLNKFVISLGLEFQWVYIFINIISYGLLVITIKKFSKNYAWSFILFFAETYFFMLGLNQIRQFVAVMLIMYAFRFIEEDNFIMWVFFVGIASLFHFVVVIMLPFYFVFNRKLSLSIFVTVSVMTIPINVFFNEILTWLYATFLPRYLNSNFISLSYSLDIPFVMCALVLMAFVILYMDKIFAVKRYHIFGNAILIGSLLAIFCTWLPDYKRFTYCFWMPSIYLIPDILGDEESLLRKCLVYGAVIAVFAIYMSQTASYWGVFPYKSMLSL